MSNFHTFFIESNKTDISRTREMIYGIYEIKEMSEHPDIGFKWIDIKPYIAKLKENDELRVNRVARVFLPGNEYYADRDCYIHLSVRQGWDDIIIEYPQCGASDLISYPKKLLKFDSLESLCANAFNIKIETMAAGAFHNLKLLGGYSAFLKFQFRVARFVYQHYRGINNHTSAEILDILGDLAVDKTALIRFKQKIGLNIGANEIDDKTLVDLL